VEALNAVVLAAGRLSAPDAARAGHEIKGLVRIGAVTPLQAMLDALRASNLAADVIVVGPRDAQEHVAGFDRWIPEGSSGEENALAGLRAARTRRVLLCASDIPFVQPGDIRDFLERAPFDAAAAYPIFERSEFLAHFPGGRDTFARLGKESWTGGSLCLIERDRALGSERLIRRAFLARRNQMAMAALLGPAVLAKHMTGTLRVEHVTERVSRLLGGKAVAVRGAHPRLAMDCDSIVDIEYARSIVQRRDA
jgi:molybdopterin-guanine dinucleotide biosynthesis protein A